MKRKISAIISLAILSRVSAEPTVEHYTNAWKTVIDGYAERWRNKPLNIMLGHIIPDSGTELSDNFETGNGSKWNDLQGTWTVVTDGNTKAYYTNAADNTSRAIIGTRSWIDYTVKAKIKVDSWGTNGKATDIGLDALHPLEVKAGMDPAGIKKRFGKDLVLNGGINVLLWDDREAVEEEMRRIVPVLKESGGYIFSSDHSIPSSVSVEDFRYIVQVAKEVGKF